MKKLFILFILIPALHAAKAQDRTTLPADSVPGDTLEQPEPAEPVSLPGDSIITPSGDTLPPDTSLSIDTLPEPTVTETDTIKKDTLASDTLSLPVGAVDTIPERLEAIDTDIRSIEGIYLHGEKGTPIKPGFMRVDTNYAKVPDLMPLPFEAKTELVYQQQWPIELPQLELKEKEPVWVYPHYVWRKGIITGFNFSQASFTNWAAGGENNLNLITFASIYFKKSTLRYEWENLIDAAYGIQSFRGLDVLRKSEDRLEFTSKIGHKTTETLFTSFLLNFKSQFDIGYSYSNDDSPPVKVSNFLAPGYITTSLGLDYKPNKAFSVLLSPISGKITLVMEQDLADQGAFGVDPAVTDTAGNIIRRGKNVRSQLGMSLNARWNTALGKNITLQSKLDMFSAYEHLSAIDVSWDNSINFRVNNVVSANLSTALIYDDDILIKKEGETVGKPRVQFKEIFSLGVRFDI